MADDPFEAEIQRRIAEQNPFEAEIQRREGDFVTQAAALDPTALSVARSKNDDFGEFLREQASIRQPDETDEQLFRRQFGGLSQAERPSLGQGIARGAFQGLTFGAGDEIVAAGAAALSGDQGGDFSQRQELLLSREREKLGQFREDRPVVSTVAEVAGALPTAALPLGAAARFGSLAARGARGVATGAAQGGLYGFNVGEGGIEDRAASAAQGAALGGGIGVAAPLVGAGVRNVANRVGIGGAAKQAGMPRPAFETLQRVMAADESLTGVGARRIEAAGPGAMLADAGANAKAILDTAISRSGPAATKARQAIEQRATAAKRRMDAALDQNLGPPVGNKTLEKALRDTTRVPIGSAYDRAYRKAIDYASDTGLQIQETLGRVPQRALENANALMRLEGAKSRQIIATVADDGTVSYQSLPDVRQLDYITRALNEVAQQTDTAGAMGGQTATGRALQNLSRDIRTLTREAVPEYGVALDTAADAIGRRQAILLGRKALTQGTTRDDLAQQIVGMSEAERKFMAAGVRAQIDDTLANVKQAMSDTNMDARQAVRLVRDLSSDASREKIAMIIGRDKAGRLFDQIDQNAMALDLRAAVAENSKTFPRQSVDAGIKAQVEEGVLNALRSGQAIGAAKRATAAVGGRTATDIGRITDETFSSLADALTSPGGAAALRQLQRAQQTVTPRIGGAQNLAEALVRRNVGVTGPTLIGR